MSFNQDSVWSKIFGVQIPSHTVVDMSYTVAMTQKGWTCTCMDYRIRKGSYEIFFDAEHFQSCKHVIDHLKDLSKKDFETNGTMHNLRWRKGFYGLFHQEAFR